MIEIEIHQFDHPDNSRIENSQEYHHLLIDPSDESDKKTIFTFVNGLERWWVYRSARISWSTREIKRWSHRGIDTGEKVGSMLELLLSRRAEEGFKVGSTDGLEEGGKVGTDGLEVGEADGAGIGIVIGFKVGSTEGFCPVAPRI